MGNHIFNDHFKKLIALTVVISALSGAISAFITIRVYLSSQSFGKLTSGFAMMEPNLVKGEIPGPLKDCQDVFEKYCKEVEPGNGRIIKCLNEHEDQLNTLCKLALKKISDMHAKDKVNQ